LLQKNEAVENEKGIGLPLHGCGVALSFLPPLPHSHQRERERRGRDATHILLRGLHKVRARKGKSKEVRSASPQEGERRVSQGVGGGREGGRGMGVSHVRTNKKRKNAKQQQKNAADADVLAHRPKSFCLPALS
jgi:hypothetical protein